MGKQALLKKALNKMEVSFLLSQVQSAVLDLLQINYKILTEDRKRSQRPKRAENKVPLQIRRRK